MMREVWIQSFILRRSLNPQYRQGADHKATGYFHANLSSFVLVPFHTFRNEYFYSAVMWSNYLCIDLGFLIFWASFVIFGTEKKGAGKCMDIIWRALVTSC